MSLFDKSLKDIHKGLRKKDISVVDLVQESLDKIKEVDETIGAFLRVDDEKALLKAEKIQQKLDRSEQVGLLAGLPVGIKDNICTKNLTTTCASQILANYEPTYNAHVVDLLNDEEAIVIGKTNLDEFAMGSTNQFSAFKPVRNPWDLNKVPGGSSGGSAAAVAAREVYMALGSDTGGSIRQPASFCGIVGLKPTYGLVSRYGLVAFASSLDQIGPLTKNVEDAAYALQAIVGYDRRDSTSIDYNKPDYTSALVGDVRGLRIALPKEMFGADEEVNSRISEMLKRFVELGAIVNEVSFPNLQHAVAAYYIIASAEASSNLARYDGVRYGVRKEGSNLEDLYTNTRSLFGPEVKRRIMLGTYALSSGYYDAYYLKAQQVRTLIIKKFEDIFSNHDLIMGPTAPTTAFDLSNDDAEDPVTIYMNDICALPVNLAGLPAISVPCGLANNLPVGLHIIGPAFSESKILDAAYVVEQECGTGLVMKSKL